ncbi:ribosome silencing factor [Parapedomonas caeni]
MPAVSAAASGAQSETTSSSGLHDLVLRSLDDDKAVEVVSIPLAGKSSIADVMVVASGRSSRQVGAMAQHLAEKVKAEFGINARIEGLPQADWVLIDAGDVVVHLFRPEVRSFYNLEKMWSVEVPAGGPKTLPQTA